MEKYVGVFQLVTSICVITFTDTRGRQKFGTAGLPEETVTNYSN